MSEHAKDHDIETGAFLAMMAADGWFLQEGDAFETMRWFVRRVRLWGDKFAVARIDREASAPEYRTVLLTCTWKGRRFDLLVGGWEPQARLTVGELQQAFTQIYESDPEQDGAINALEDRSGRKSLLTDPKACLEIAGDLRKEMHNRAAACVRYLDKLDRVENWRGEIPKSALVFMRVWKPGAE